MSTISTNATAGLRASEVRLATAANNIANATTKNFKALDYTQTVDESGNPVAEVTTRDPATLPVVNEQGAVEQLPNVSLDEEVIATQLATYDFKANATVLKTQQDLQKRLVDILA